MTTPAGTVELRELVLPALANHRSTLYAGEALRLLAKVVFLSARSLAQREVVMAGVTGVDFIAPVAIGQQLVLRAWVTRVGRSSMTICASGLADAPGIPPEEAIKGMFEMVAVDTAGRPVPIDPSYLNKETMQ